MHLVIDRKEWWRGRPLAENDNPDIGCFYLLYKEAGGKGLDLPFAISPFEIWNTNDSPNISEPEREAKLADLIMRGDHTVKSVAYIN